MHSYIAPHWHTASSSLGGTSISAPHSRHFNPPSTPHRDTQRLCSLHSHVRWRYGHRYTAPQGWRNHRRKPQCHQSRRYSLEISLRLFQASGNSWPCLAHLWMIIRSSGVTLVPTERSFLSHHPHRSHRGQLSSGGPGGCIGIALLCVICLHCL